MPTESQSIFDTVFTREMRARTGLTDAEAEIIYRMWKGANKGAKRFILPEGTDSGQVTTLKAKGYLSGFGTGMELTDRGRKVIIEMVTHEPNAFDKNAAMPTYTSIKAAKKRPIQAFLRKSAAADDQPSETKPFNMRRHSLKRMAGEE